MPRIHFRSHTLLLWLSLSATAVSALVIGCSSSDDPGTVATAGKGSGGAHSAGATGSNGGSTNSEAGEPGAGGVPDQPPDETSEGGRAETPSGGSSGAVAVAGGVSGGSTGSGDAGAPGEGGAGGAPEPGGDPELEAAQARAIALIEGIKPDTSKCYKCHQLNYQGAGFYPNITPHVENGIGSWSEEEIKTAIRDGKDKDGNTLCATMERYDFTDAQLSDLAIYLKHLPPVDRKTTSKCPSF